MNSIYIIVLRGKNVPVSILICFPDYNCVLSLCMSVIYPFYFSYLPMKDVSKICPFGLEWFMCIYTFFPQTTSFSTCRDPRRLPDDTSAVSVDLYSQLLMPICLFSAVLFPLFYLTPCLRRPCKAREKVIY